MQLTRIDRLIPNQRVNEFDSVIQSARCRLTQPNRGREPDSVAFVVVDASAWVSLLSAAASAAAAVGGGLYTRSQARTAKAALTEAKRSAIADIRSYAALDSAKSDRESVALARATLDHEDRPDFEYQTERGATGVVAVTLRAVTGPPRIKVDAVWTSTYSWPDGIAREEHRSRERGSKLRTTRSLKRSRWSGPASAGWLRQRVSLISHAPAAGRHRTRPDPLQVGQTFRPSHTRHLTVPRPVFRLPSPSQAKHRRLPLQPGQSRDTAQPPFTFTQVTGTFVRIRRSVTGGSDRRIPTRTVRRRSEGATSM